MLHTKLYLDMLESYASSLKGSDRHELELRAISMSRAILKLASDPEYQMLDTLNDVKDCFPEQVVEELVESMDAQELSETPLGTFVATIDDVNNTAEIEEAYAQIQKLLKSLPAQASANGLALSGRVFKIHTKH